MLYLKNMTQTKECPICNNQSTISNKDYGMQLIIDCGSCGRFKIISSLSEGINSDKNRHIIAGHLYATKNNRPEEYLLNKEQINSILAAPFNKPANITDQLDTLLLHIEKISSHIGAETDIPLLLEYPIVYAINPEEFGALFQLLEEMQYIRIINKTEKTTMQVKLLYKGYQRLQELKKTIKNTERCFVAMPINKGDEIESLYKDGIKGVLEEKKYIPPFRVDEERKTDYITNKIIANIRISSLLIAEVTPFICKVTHDNGNKEDVFMHNANVYYETGFARGLDIPIIYLCRKDRLKHLPFDTNTINHLPWDPENINKFRDDLKDWINANIKKV